jgi:hypothetical protein
MVVGEGAIILRSDNPASPELIVNPEDIEIQVFSAAKNDLKWTTFTDGFLDKSGVNRDFVLPNDFLYCESLIST